MNRILLKIQVLILLFLLKIPDLYSQTLVEQTGIVLPGVRYGSTTWGDYDNDGDLDILLTGQTSSGNISKIYRNNGDNSFTEQTGIILTGVRNSSVAWGDYDNDGDLDILLTGHSTTGYVSKVYRNNSDNTFTAQSSILLAGVDYSSVDWGDYDNDGDLDILLTGFDGNNEISKIYRNNGNNTFTEQPDILLTCVNQGSVAWGDYDDDGHIDILLSGKNGSDRITKIYKNVGNNSFVEQTEINLTGVSGGSVSWSDYDNDGFLDILLTGVTSGSSNSEVSKIYHNNGNNTFTEQTDITLTPVTNSSVVWGDYDNDGNKDILLTGYTGSSRISTIYRNSGNNSFTEQASISITGVENSSAAWGDYDNDGDLDIILTGYSGTRISKIFRNDVSTSNSMPIAPANLQTQINGGIVTFTWDKATDNQTSQEGLSYNLYVYESGQTTFKCPPHSFMYSHTMNGRRLIAESGNIQYSTDGYTLKDLPPEKTFYWSVQAIDGGFQGSNFPNEENFTMPLYRPLSQSYNLTFSNVQDDQVTATWENGAAAMRAVFIKQGTTGEADPVDNITYAINSYTPDGWKCVYNGTGDSTLITGLTAGADYLIHVCEYNGTPGSEKYLKTSVYRNPAALSTVFIEQTDISITPVSSGSLAWGDYDNDADLDLIVTGASSSGPISSIYRNNGNNTFTYRIMLTGVSNSSVSWRDFDRDDDLDILLAGMDEGWNPVSKIYRNNGNSTFTEQTGISLAGVYWCHTDCDDYDNDGDADILLTGYSNSVVTEVYCNKGNLTFDEEENFDITGAYRSTVAWGDYNNDHYPDILLTGVSSEGSISRIYRNNGDNTFSEQTTITLPGVTDGSVDWGDYDNDGDLDILLTGLDVNNRCISTIYSNNGNNSFTEQTGISLTGVCYGFAEWGDYDDDGDLDILLAGRIADNFGSNNICRIYQNNGNNTFTEQTGIVLDGLSGTWGDYDNDGDLDIILTGRTTETSIVTKIYRNNCIVINKVPDKPSDLTYEIQGKNVQLKWNRVNTDETSSRSITYNIRLGTKTRADNLILSHSDINGFRRIVELGNAQFDTTLTYRNLRWDTIYYASVQAIDNSFKGGTFSDEVNFKIRSIQPSDLFATHISTNSLMVRWERGNGDRCILFAREGTTGTAVPQNGTTYYANPAFGEGSPIESTGWYCIYRGEADSVLLSGLNPKKNYTVHAIEFQGAIGAEIYADTLTAENVGIFSSGLFTEQSGIPMLPLYCGSAAWGDYDNDGFLDIVISGNDNDNNLFSKIYRNNGNHTFTEQTEISLTGATSGSVAWGDYNNDNYLDILLTGGISKIYKNNGGNTFIEDTSSYLDPVDLSSGSWGDYDNDGYLDIILTGSNFINYTNISKIYRNNGNNNFTEQTNISLEGVVDGFATWGDYDNDGNLDILLPGSLEPFSKIYKNEGNGNFIYQQGIILPGGWMGSFAWGDYDNDGDPDLLLTGISGSESISKIYRNNGDNSFTEQTEISLLGVYRSSVAWGDYNNDGNLDILLTGESNSGYKTKLYRNNGNNTFTEETGVSLTNIAYSSVSWGDYDNDGDIDILITGRDPNGDLVSSIYSNNLILKSGTAKSNAPPAAPIGLVSTITPDKIKLSWSSVGDDETPPKSMSYNMRFKSRNDSIWKFAPHSSDSGYRRVPAMGNLYLNKSFHLKNLSPGTYYWQIQAVDQGYMGGAWSAVDSFEVRNVQAFYSADEVCLGFPTTFTDQSLATDGIASWNWDFKDGSSSLLQNPVHHYTSSGTYNVKLVITDNNGIKDSIEHEVIVRPKPLADFTAPDVCQGMPVTATNKTNNNGLTISSWKWDFEDGNISSDQQPPPHPYLNAGDYNIKLKATASNGCADSVAHVASVGAYPVAAITANAPLTFCKGGSVTLSVPDSSEYLYTWQAGGVPLTGGNTYSYVAGQTGNYSIKIINPKGNCTTTSSEVTVTAKEAPAAPYIEASGSLTFCQGDSVELSVTNTLNYTYQWKKDGGAVGMDSSIFVARSSGTYDLTVTNSSGCSVNSANQADVTVTPSPSAGNISLSGPASFCQGGSVTLNVPLTAGYKYRWRNEYGEMPGADTNSYTATTSGKYQLEVSNTSGCTARTAAAIVTVNASPLRPVLAALNYDAGKCPGLNPVRLSADQTIEGYRYLWYKDGLPQLKDTLSYLDLYEKGLYKLEAGLKECKTESDIFTIDFPEAPAKPLLYVRGPVVWYMASSNSKASYYRWYRNNELITGANENIYVANKTLGTYKVAIGNESECYTFSDEVTIPVAKSQMTNFHIPKEYLVSDGTDPFESLQIYPNPTTGVFTIEIDNDILGELNIEIITEQGKEIRNIRSEKTTEHYTTEIDLGNSPEGVYFINLRIDKYLATRKLIIE